MRMGWCLRSSIPITPVTPSMLSMVRRLSGRCPARIVNSRPAKEAGISKTGVEKVPPFTMGLKSVTVSTSVRPSVTGGIT